MWIRMRRPPRDVSHLLEQSVFFRERHMTHFPRRFPAAHHANEFVIRPKSSIQQREIAFRGSIVSNCRCFPVMLGA